MSKPAPCGFPGCIALALSEGFCAVHRRVIVCPERHEPRGDPDEARTTLRQLVLEWIPEAETTFSGIEVLPLPVPALLDFQFH